MNYYEILNVSKDATQDEIKKSYKKLIKKYHPDIFEGNKEEANQKVKELNEAYEILSNPELKKSYDDVLFAPSATTFDFSSDVSSNSVSSDMSPPKQKYEDLYRYDYYKKYTTNYYGVSRDDLKSEKSKTYADRKKDEEFNATSSYKSKLIIVIGLASIIFLILLIILLSYLKSAMRAPYSDLSNNIVLDNNLPHIDLGMTYVDVRKLLDSPDFVEDKNGNFYAYWGLSYIIFNDSEEVIGWHNYGDSFYTDTVTGEDLTEMRKFYNAIEQELYSF